MAFFLCDLASRVAWFEWCRQGQHAPNRRNTSSLGAWDCRPEYGTQGASGSSSRPEPFREDPRAMKGAERIRAILAVVQTAVS